MSIEDRPYWKDDTSGGTGGGLGGGLSWGLPKMTPAVKWLLIINAAVFVVQIFLDRGGAINAIYTIFGVSVGRFWAFWTYLTFQFLHSTQDVWHIALNMLGIYFFGTTLEKMWGSKTFLRFYLACGAAAGLLYVVIGAIFRTSPEIPLVGASGGVFGLLLACAVYCPQFRVIILVLPVPIRLVAVVIFAVMGFRVLQAASHGNVDSVMSDVAHLGGAMAAAFRIWAWPAVKGENVQNTSANSRQGTWKQRIADEAAQEREVDRILEKIQHEGIGSLSNKERKTLQQATERQREKDRRMNNTFKNR